MARSSVMCRSIATAPKLAATRSEEHTSELQSQSNLVCRLLLEKKKHTKDLLSSDAKASNSSSISCIPTDIIPKCQPLQLAFLQLCRFVVKYSNESAAMPSRRSY